MNQPSLPTRPTAPSVRGPLGPSSRPAPALARTAISAAMTATMLVMSMAPAAATAQTLSIAPKIGTVGVGADLGIGLGDAVVLRGGFGLFPIDWEQEYSGIDWKVQLPSDITVGLDFHPWGGIFRFSAGVMARNEDLTIDGAYEGSVTIGDETYTDDEVGALTGVVENNRVAPFAMIGLGKHGTSGFGLFVDLGAAWLGDPTLTVDASGLVADDPEFQANLERERADIEDELDTWARWYPILTLGFKIGF